MVEDYNVTPNPFTYEPATNLHGPWTDDQWLVKEVRPRWVPVNDVYVSSDLRKEVKCPMFWHESFQFIDSRIFGHVKTVEEKF